MEYYKLYRIRGLILISINAVNDTNVNIFSYNFSPFFKIKKINLLYFVYMNFKETSLNVWIKF